MHEIVLEREQRILRVNYSGQVDITQRKAAAIAVLELATSHGIDRFLLDYRRASVLIGDAPLKHALANYVSGQLDHAKARIAWLVVHDHQLNRDVENLTHELGVASRRFHSLDAAFAWLERDDIEELGAAPATPSPPRRALVLAMEAVDLDSPLSPVQFAGVVKLVQELLDAGIQEPRARQMAKRMFEIIRAEAPRNPPKQFRAGPFSTFRG